MFSAVWMTGHIVIFVVRHLQHETTIMNYKNVDLRNTSRRDVKLEILILVRDEQNHNVIINSYIFHSTVVKFP